MGCWYFWFFEFEKKIMERKKWEQEIYFTHWFVMKHRRFVLGVQVLADVFAQLRYDWDSKEAGQWNKEIFETIYFASLTSSMEIAIKEGPYASFKGSPVSKDILQYHMWNVTPAKRWGWDGLIKNIN